MGQLGYIIRVLNMMKLPTITFVFFCIHLSLSTAKYTEPHCDGKQVIVHLFEWPWDAVARECEEVLGPKGFCGVQVSPPMEHIQGGQWWTCYQPVSYKLESRSGNRDQFINMVNRCRNAGVMVVADMVINHRTWTIWPRHRWFGIQWRLIRLPRSSIFQLGLS